ncbi:uncharacterized protein LOC106673113 [Cimex lectularius]|uniref:Uncharacterized protein n=1 Tax=Cimex lectularius TaxID=79782 RepID=A0A8I6SAS8_CIMLE|nr:uncharacterized protein LOC106673113 [Cimex lectularius]
MRQRNMVYLKMAEVFLGVAVFSLHAASIWWGHHKRNARGSHVAIATGICSPMVPTLFRAEPALYGFNDLPKTIIIGLAIFVIHYHSYLPADWATNFFITLGFCGPLLPQIYRMEGLKSDEIPMDKLSDMLFSSFAAWVYMVGGAFQYKYLAYYLTLYKTCGSFMMALFFLIDLIVTWCSAADDEILIRNGVFFLIVARQEQWKVKDVRLQEDKMPITAPSTKIEPDSHYYRPRFMRPWGKAYFRVCDDEVAEKKLEDLLRMERKRRGKEALTPQERLLRAIEMKREIANALREQRIERAGRTISQNLSYR